MGCLRPPTGVSGVRVRGKNILTPHSYIFWSVKGVKCPLNPNSHIILPPLTEQKDVRVGGGGNLYFTPSLPHHFTPVGSPVQPNSYIILTTSDSYTILSPLAAQLLAHFTPSERINPNSYITLTPLQLKPYLILPPLNKLLPHLYTIVPPWQLNS